MKIKIIGILVCGLLITNVSAILGVSANQISPIEKANPDIFVDVFDNQLNQNIWNFITPGEVLNDPPLTPSTPSGPTTGVVGISYRYTTSTTDPDDDLVKFGWDGGDGVVDFWTDYYNSGEICSVPITFLNPGTYHLQVKARDNNGAESGFSYYLKVVITPANNKPNVPNRPVGPTSGMIGTSYTYSTSTTDPDGDTVKYGWDWNGDGTVDEWTGLSTSGVTVSTPHTFVNIGLFNVTVMAEDEHGAQSSFSSALAITIRSNPPNKPDRPTGTASGTVGHLYSYQTSATDPDGDQLSYMWDWGDGSYSDWIGLYGSGVTSQKEHSWNVTGDYTIKVKAKDNHGEESPWSDPLSITMPCSYNKPIPQFLELLFQRFPNAFPILRQLMG